MKTVLKQFYQDERGGGAVEYALIIGLVAVAAVTALTGLGTKLSNSFTNTANKIT